MIKKEAEKEIAIKLRKEGKTYTQILLSVKVAKSTLALWLQSVGLSKKQKQRITELRIAGALRGAQTKKKQRILRQRNTITEAQSEITNISDRELFLIGTILYWAEGAKEKEYSPGSQLRFANSDPYMIKLFLIWLSKIGVRKDRIIFDIYLHDNNKYRSVEVVKYWSLQTGFPKNNFKIYYKYDIPKTKRRNLGPESYFGLARIYVKESSEIVRKIHGWVKGIVGHVR